MKEAENLKEEIKITESVSAITESQYLLISNRKKVNDLVVDSDLSEDDMIEIFISLHIILEVGINALFRKLIIPMLKKEIPTEKMEENLDDISFKDKVVMFIYYSKFDFSDIKKASDYHSIIGKIKKFSFMRNRLLHGHSISTHYNGDKNIKSKLKENLNLSKLQEQISDFRFILDGMCFYLDSLDMGVTPSGKESYKKSFLDHSFIPNTSFSSE